MGSTNSHQALAKICCDQTYKHATSAEDLITDNFECISEMTHDSKLDVFHDGANAISWCCFHGDIDRLNHLSKLNEKKSLGRSFDPLVVSPKTNETSLDLLLTRFGSLIRAASIGNTNQNFFHDTARKYLECLKFLLKMDPGRNNETLINKHIHPNCNTTPLQYLCFIDRNPEDALDDTFKKIIQDMAIELLANGAEVNPSNSDPSKHMESINVAVGELEKFPAKVFGLVLRASPLHLACRQGNQYLVGELLTAGANVNAVDSINQTPLMYAAKYGHVSCFKILCGVPNIRFDISQTTSHCLSVVHFCILQYRSRRTYSEGKEGIVDMREMLHLLIEQSVKLAGQKITDQDGKEIDAAPKFAMTDLMKKAVDAGRKAAPKEYTYKNNALRMWVKHIAFTPTYQKSLDPATQSLNLPDHMFHVSIKDKETMLKKMKERYDGDELKLDAEYEKELGNLL